MYDCWLNETVGDLLAHRVSPSGRSEYRASCILNTSVPLSLGSLRLRVVVVQVLATLVDCGGHACALGLHILVVGYLVVVRVLVHHERAILLVGALQLVQAFVDLELLHRVRSIVVVPGPMV